MLVSTKRLHQVREAVPPPRLIEIARSLVHPHGGSCERCAEGKALRPGGPTLFLELLQAADESWARNLFRGLFDPAILKIFVH